MAFPIKPGQTLLFTGDSITDANRRGAEVPLGSGYVRMTNDLIIARYPAHQLRVINTGISGNTIRDLFSRWSDDVIVHQPHWLSIMIGVNDLHRTLRNAPADQIISPEEFADTYDKLLTRVTKETKAKLILIDPFYITRDDSPGSFRTSALQTLPKFIKVVHALVKKYKTVHVPLHAMFQDQLKHRVADTFCPEPVHPNLSGHLLMAHAWLRAMGW